MVDRKDPPACWLILFMLLPTSPNVCHQPRLVVQGTVGSWPLSEDDFWSSFNEFDHSLCRFHALTKYRPLETLYLIPDLSSDLRDSLLQLHVLFSHVNFLKWGDLGYLQFYPSLSLGLVPSVGVVRKSDLTTLPCFGRPVKRASSLRNWGPPPNS